MRFYRFNLSTSADYEAMRAAVDTALGYSGGVTCIQPYASAPQDSKGRVLLSISPATPGYSLLVLQLNALIVASKVRELDQNWYEFSLEPIVTGGGGGSSAWGDVTGKPFESLGSGLTVTSGVLSASGASYTLPVATASVLGGVKQGANTTIAADGTISVAAPVTSLPYGSITGTPTLAAVATSGSASDLGSGTLPAARLPATAVTGGSYGSASSVATFTVDAAGRLTAAGSVAIAIAAGAVSGLASIATSGSATDLGSGTLPFARIPVGTSSTTVCVGNDSRLSDARTPTAHTHSAADITSGTMATARLGSGTASSATFLRGDQTYATPSSMVEHEFTVASAPAGYTGSGTSGSPYTLTGGVPAGAKMVMIQMVGGGGGGGGGYRRATGSVAGGGGGGGGAASCVRFADVSGLDGQTVTVQVGAGGGGGSGGLTADGTNGSAGTAGGDSLVRIGTTARYWLAAGGNGGGGGTTAAGTSGTNGSNTEFPGVAGGASSVTATPTGVTRSSANCVGGGGGGGCTAANAQFAGAAGTGPTLPLLYSGAATTATTGTAGTAGTAGGGNGGAGSAAGGGAGGGGNATGAGGAGGAGGDYGGGGGGGGVGTGANGGAGGNGGAGFVRIAWMF